MNPITLIKAAVIALLSLGVFGGAAWFAYYHIIQPELNPTEAQLAENAPPLVDPSLPEFERVMAVRASGKPQAALPAARAALEKFMADFPFSTKMAEAKKALGEVNIEIFFASSIVTPEKIRYEVRPGDVISKVEKKLKTTREQLMRCNNLDDERRLRIGQVLVVSQTEFSVIVERKARRVVLLNHGKFFKEYAPKSWSPPAERNAAPIKTKVGQKTAWADGAQVLFGSKEYAESARWIDLSVKGYTLYTEGGQKPGSGGIGLSPQEMDELSVLLVRGLPVVIQN